MYTLRSGLRLTSYNYSNMLEGSHTRTQDDKALEELKEQTWNKKIRRLYRQSRRALAQEGGASAGTRLGSFHIYTIHYNLVQYYGDELDIQC